ncbi:tyrosine-type recombinase/integrase [Chloroflexota bacterium]
MDIINPSWVDLLDSYRFSLKAANRSPKTISWYLDILERFFRFLSESGLLKPISEIGTSEVREYILYLQQAERWPNNPHITQKGKLSPYSVQGHVRAIRAFWGWLYDEQHIDHNALIKFPLPKVPHKIMPTLTIEQIKMLLSKIDRHTSGGAKFYCILLLLIDTGVRISELVNIKLSDLNLIMGYARVTGKGGKERVVPIYKTTRKELMLYINHMRSKLCPLESPYLFPDPAGDHITVGSIQQYLKRLARKAGLNGIRCSPHVFRHTFATQSAAADANVFALKDIMGHSSLQTTLKYTHLTAGDLKNHHNKFSPVAALTEGE